MKVILDITKLVNEGKITQTEFEKYRQISTGGTEAFLSNILVGLGVIAFGRDILVIQTHINQNMTVISLFSMALGIWLVRTRQQWILLGTICILVGVFLIRYSAWAHLIRFI